MEEIAAELKRCGEALMKLSEALAAPTNVEKQPSLEEVRGLLTKKTLDGFRDEVRELLKKYGASRLSELKPECYGALMKEAEVIGHAG